MTLTSGTRLGPYEILSPIGAGGMGEVYKARDTRLDRGVAVKVLSSHLSATPHLRERFDREARAISSLSHPNICALFDVGHQDGVDYLVMEYLEGESLAGRLVRGPLPFAEVLRSGAQIADALAAAHGQGIVHRDLKPGNVMLTKSGAKLLDFGLAKSTLVTPLAHDAPTALQNPLTQEGTILGTLQYMSPEQLDGVEADARSDIFAFGAMVYEMVTGRRAFEAATRSSLITAIAEREPLSIRTNHPDVPAAFSHLIFSCLAKNREERWQSAKDVATQLRWIASTSDPDPVTVPKGVSRRQQLLLLFAALAFASAAILAGIYWRPAPMQAAAVHLSANLPVGTLLESDVVSNNIVLSPDGSQLAIVVSRAGERKRIWLRSLAKGNTIPLAGTEDADGPFWSPDGKFLAFFAGGQLKKIAAAGGPTQTICRATVGNGSWNPEDVILFAESEGREGILRVDASGGEPVLALAHAPRRPAWHFWVQFLPDGKRFFYVETNAKGERSVFLASLEGGKSVRVPDVNSRAMYADGYLVYVREAALLAQKFDLDSVRFDGEPIVLAAHVPYFETTGWADFSLANNGTVAFQGGAILTRLVWFDRSGREIGAIGQSSGYGSISLSPDQKKLAFSRADPKSGNDDIWIYDLAREVETRFTSEPGNEFNPIWHPDGDRVLFAYDVLGSATINEKRLNEQGRGRSLLPIERFKLPLHYSPDRKVILFSDTGTETGWDLWLLSFEDPTKPRPFQQSSFEETGGEFSPDSRHIAFVSSESGLSEVYVQRSDGGGEKYRISVAGGTRPQWRKDGKEIFYLASDDMIMAVPSSTGKAFEAGRAVPLFRINPLRFKAAANLFDVTDDGQKFLVNSRLAGSESPPVDIIMNWTRDAGR